MKNALKILILLSISFCNAQSPEQVEKVQTGWTKKAEQHIGDKQLDKAFFAYGLVSKRDSLTEKGKVASLKADSLKVILRDKLKSNIIGTWKWKYSGSNWGISETSKESKKDKMLIISDNSLSFYETDKLTNKMTLVETQKLKFNDIYGMFPAYWELLYTNNKIWSFHLKNEGQNLQIIYTGEITENNSRTEMLCGNLELTYERIK